MANKLGGFELTWFANEALIYLMQALGFGSRVHRGYDPSPQQKGSTITIPVPGDFEVRDAPSVAQDIEAGQVDIKLDQWKEVKTGLTDRDLAYTEDQIIETHIEPMAYAIAAHVDERLAALSRFVPYAVNWSDADPVGSLLAAREILRENGAPLMPGSIHQALDARLESRVLGAPFMYQHDSAGSQGRNPLVSGTLGRRFGIDFFANALARQHTSGTVISAGNDAEGALSAAAVKGATTIGIDGLSGTETLKEGDSFAIAGSTQRYVVTSDTALAAGANAAVEIYPALVQDYADNSVVTFEDGTGAGVHADSFAANLQFHRHFAALATAPLQSHLGSEMARRQGIEVETITDTETNISIRARRWYDPDQSKVMIALDLLYGYKVLNPNLAVNLRRDI